MTAGTVARPPRIDTFAMSNAMRTALCILAAALLLGGCSGASAPTPKHAPQAATSTHARTPWDGMLKDEAKAKHVQKIVDDAAKRQQQAIDKQTH